MPHSPSSTITNFSEEPPKRGNFSVRRTRSIGLRKTHLQHLLTAVATNIVRLVLWLEGRQFTKTRTSRFAALAA